MAKISAFLLSVFFQYLVAQSVIKRSVNLQSLYLWLWSIILFCLSFPLKTRAEKIFKKGKKNLPRNLLLFLTILLGVGVRIAFMLDGQRFHGDEYQTAYFSYSLGKLSEIDWFGVYPERGGWVSQFPIPFFFFQKVFFNILGPNTLTLRFSVLPYVLGVFLFSFLLIEKLFSSKTAFVATVILAFLAPDIYLSSLGLHFISSTAFFLASLYFFLRSLESNNKIDYLLTGCALAFSYLTYYSSYIAFPSLVFFLVLLILTKKIKLKTLTNQLLTLGVFIYVLSPLITYAWKVDNFFTQRSDQVSVFSGEWSPHVNEKITTNLFFSITKDQIKTSFASLYKDGIGGHGGYDFGKLALLDKVTFSGLVLGAFFFLYKGVVKKSVKHLFFLAVIFVSYLTGIVFTIPPPAYHRFSIAFPFISFVIGVSLVGLSSFVKKVSAKISLIFLWAGTLSIIFLNLTHFDKVLGAEGFGFLSKSVPKQELLLIENGLKKLPNQKIYISAFGSYALGRILFFRFNSEREFITDHIDRISLNAKKSESPLLIIHLPDDETLRKTRAAFPNYKILKKYESHYLLSLF